MRAKRDKVGEARRAWELIETTALVESRRGINTENPPGGTQDDSAGEK